MFRSWTSGLEDMAISFRLLPLGLVLLVSSGTHALRVTPGSSCSDVCQGTTATSSSDIVCADVDYYALSSGDTFKDCIQCLQTSNATSDSENDVSWFLYNLRYASAVCLYDFPKHRDNSTASCDLEYACSPLQGALEAGNLNPSRVTEYGYCQADSNAFYGTAVDDCVSCLQSSSSNYMANFLLALQAGCQQEPAAGQLLSISGDIFSGSAISIRNSSSATTSSSSSGDDDDGTLSTGAKVGIGVSLGGLFLAALVLFAIYWRHQRRYEQQDHGATHPYGFRGGQQQHYYYPKEPDSGGSGGPSSMSTATAPPDYALQNYTVDYKSQFSGDVSPEPAPQQQRQPGLHLDLPVEEFINNADYYDRLDGKSRGRPLKALPLRLHPTTNNINNAPSDNGGSSTTAVESALPTHPAYIPRSQFPGQLGGRASRNNNNTTNKTPSASQRSTASSFVSFSAASSSAAATAAKQQEWPQSTATNHNKSDPSSSYAIQVYLNAPHQEDDINNHSNKPARNLYLELGSRADAQGGTQVSPPPPPPPPASQGARGSSSTPAPAQFFTRAGGETAAPRLPSLILPPVPRIRVPGRRGGPPPPSYSSPVPLHRDIAIHHSIISGPLAFPDSRFTTGDDRIVEQTVDRAAHPHIVEVPIASGKSYLYG